MDDLTPKELADLIYDDRRVFDRIDDVFDTLDDLCLAGDFERIDAMFCLLMEERMDEALDELDVTLAILTVTLGAPDQLPARSEFLETLESALLKDRTKGEVQVLLTGLD